VAAPWGRSAVKKGARAVNHASKQLVVHRYNGALSQWLHPGTELQPRHITLWHEHQTALSKAHYLGVKGGAATNNTAALANSSVTTLSF